MSKTLQRGKKFRRIKFSFSVFQLYLSKTRQSGLTDDLHLSRTVSPTVRQQGKSLSLSLNIFFPSFYRRFSSDALPSRISTDSVRGFVFLPFSLSFSLSLEFARNFPHPRTHRTVSFNVLTTRYSPRAYISKLAKSPVPKHKRRNFGQFRVYSNRINMRSTCASPIYVQYVRVAYKLCLIHSVSRDLFNQ